MTSNDSEEQLFNLSLSFPLRFPAWLKHQKVNNMLPRAQTASRVRALAGSLPLVLNQKCIGSSYHSGGSLKPAASRQSAAARDLGRSISDGSIHSIPSDNLILENMTHQSARTDSHHQRVDGSAGRAYLWGYWRVYSGCPRTLLLPICLSVCQSVGARSSVLLQNSSFFKRLNCQKARAVISTPRFLTKT